MGAPADAAQVGGNYKLVSYGCAANYVMTDWWPQNMFDSEDNYFQTEGSDETALVHVSADTDRKSVV